MVGFICSCLNAHLRRTRPTPEQWLQEREEEAKRLQVEAKATLEKCGFSFVCVRV